MISIDPGATVGFALWDDHGILLSAGSHAFAKFVEVYGTDRGLRAVIEMPDHFAAHMITRGPKFVSDVLKCAWRSGYIAAHFPNHRLVNVGDWKGTVPKAVTQRRATKALSDCERARTEGLSHHAWDAIAIGLFELGRLKR